MRGMFSRNNRIQQVLNELFQPTNLRIFMQGVISSLRKRSAQYRNDGYISQKYMQALLANQQYNQVIRHFESYGKGSLFFQPETSYIHQDEHEQQSVLGDQCYKMYLEALVRSNRLHSTKIAARSPSINHHAGHRHSTTSDGGSRGTPNRFSNTINNDAENPIAVTVVKGKWETLPKVMYYGLSLALFYYIYQRMFGSGGDSPQSMFKQIRQSNHTLASDVNVTLDDVIGIEEIKDEIDDVIDYLCDPTAAKHYGVQMTRGILLHGPPGVGKTLLAKGIAGEADVPFYYVSASGLEEMFVGVGAMRLRQVFKDATEHAPSIIFIDEIDTIARKRGSRVFSNGSADQTINQMLALMDGFEENAGVIVIGATNSDPSELDQALMRSGRFDKKMRVPLPMKAARAEMVSLFLKNVLHDQDQIDISEVAAKTFRMTGADIANLVNVAATKAMREGSRVGVTQQMLLDAIQDIRMGPTNRSMIVSDDELKRTATHEGGHTIVALYDADAEDPATLTVIPRGSALGYMVPGGDDQTSVQRDQYLASIAVALGGKAAEHLFYGDDGVTSGASSDLKQATDIAYNMVANFGMGDTLTSYGTRDKDDVSELTKQQIDQAVESILQERYQYVIQLLKSKATEHTRLIEAIMEYETLHGEDIRRICEGLSPLGRKQ